MTEEKRRMYRRRQITLIVCVAIVLVALIVGLVTLLVSKDREPIENSQAISPTTSETEATIENTYEATQNEIPADVKNEDTQGDFYFDLSEKTIKAGESFDAVVVNNTGVEGEYIWESSNQSVAIVNEGYVTGQAQGSCDITVTIRGTNNNATMRVYVEAGEHEVVVENGVTYIDGILLANKSYPLPADYDPGINQEALDAFYEMQDDAAAEGLDIYISSDYRSYYDQERIYNNYVSSDGQETADTYSSRPGYSDHQTGLAFDLNSIDDSFGYTPESDWVAVNAHKYGFIIRFPEGKAHFTGYQYEPWHIRYLGVDKATEVYESGLCLEEFLSVDSAYKN